MKTLLKGLVCSALVLFLAGQAMAQPAGTKFRRLFQCDVPSDPALKKLRFVHEVIADVREDASKAASAAGQNDACAA